MIRQLSLISTLYPIQIDVYALPHAAATTRTSTKICSQQVTGASSSRWLPSQLRQDAAL